MKRFKLIVGMMFTLMVALLLTGKVKAKTKTDDLVENLKELAKSFDGVVNYENDTIEIEWNIQNSNSSEITFSYNGNVIEYNSGEITSYEEAEDVTNHLVYAIYLIESALKVNGYSDEKINTFFSSEESEFDYEINGIEFKEIGEAKKFTSEDGSMTTTVTPMSMKIDVAKANLNKSSEEPLPTVSTTVEDVVNYLQNDNEFTSTEYEGKVVYENEIYNDEDVITIYHTYYWEDYHNVYFTSEDDVISYKDEEIEDYYDAERAYSHQMFMDIIISSALKLNGYTSEQIQEFMSSNKFNYDLNGIEYKEIGEEQEFTSEDGLSTIIITLMSFKIDLVKANLNKASEEKVEYKVLNGASQKIDVTNDDELTVTKDRFRPRALARKFL